jgi:molybdopterin-guanine dinucleotide biosynthesis protein A
VDQPAYAAVVLAGGAARRLGGVRKPVLPVAGRSLLGRVLTAVADARVRVVVGPSDLPVPPGVLVTREEPAGGGPVAGAAAGLALVPSGVETVALLASDLPLLDAAAVGVLRASLASGVPDRAGAAVFVDEAGRRQSLCGVWRTAALRAALDRLVAARSGPPAVADGDPLAGASMRGLLVGVRVAEVSWAGDGPPPWFDCDTDADLRRAEEWVR